MDSESLSSWTNPPSSAQLQRREGGVCWFLHWPPYKVAHHFSRWFMNIYMHKLFGKWKLICNPTGDDLAICFYQRTQFFPFKTRMLHCFLSYIPKYLDIKLSMLLLYEGKFCFIAMFFLLLQLITTQLNNLEIFLLQELFVLGYHHLVFAILGVNLYRKHNPSLWKQYDNVK